MVPSRELDATVLVLEAHVLVIAEMEEIAVGQGRVAAGRENDGTGCIELQTLVGIADVEGKERRKVSDLGLELDQVGDDPVIILDEGGAILPVVDLGFLWSARLLAWFHFRLTTEVGWLRSGEAEHGQEKEEE